MKSTPNNTKDSSFQEKIHPEIRKGSPRARALNESGIGKICNFQPITHRISDDRDRAEAELESETPGPVSDRTRSKTKREGDASRYDSCSIVEHEAGTPGADATDMKRHVPHSDCLLWLTIDRVPTGLL